MRQTNCMKIGKLPQQLGVGSAMIWALLAFPLQAQPDPIPLSQAELFQAELSQAEPSPSALSSELCAAQNSLQRDGQMILGEIPDSPYVVVVPGQGAEPLTAVRQCVPDAFQTHARLGSYIRAGAFSNRRSAERLSRHLRRSLKLNARVMYWP